MYWYKAGRSRRSDCHVLSNSIEFTGGFRVDGAGEVPETVVVVGAIVAAGVVVGGDADVAGGAGEVVGDCDTGLIMVVVDDDGVVVVGVDRDVGLVDIARS